MVVGANSKPIGISIWDAVKKEICSLQTHQFRYSTAVEQLSYEAAQLRGGPQGSWPSGQVAFFCLVLYRETVFVAFGGREKCAV